MIIIPAIDLKEGKCVRLTQGKADEKTIYSENPVEVAQAFFAEGARMLHLVDLDGAFHGKPANLEVIKAIRKGFGGVIELGGGMRRMEDIEGMLALGLDMVVVGTAAVRDPLMVESALKQFGGERIILGVDTKDGRVAVSGWVEETPLEAIEFALQWKARGVQRVIYTDISRDGMLQGPNFAAIETFGRATGLKVTASGGISSVKDLSILGKMASSGVDMAIVGKAIYEGNLLLEELF
ncbi:MAG: 1-(5-phosphoribosyl)-5-[(5-phosphoribosylamino)methylideneamino]imidazole-4-carboxamide isomerase [Deltaproteobacteria bacterium]|nr:1-(5-phosphoribosyl)-5-[(5-phosphoribosylamino)methylideneamino]imidazole-4-carboxamide isomerase [Deltaproteobacteria bacterium]